MYLEALSRKFCPASMSWDTLPHIPGLTTVGRVSYRHCLGPSNGLCTGLGARLLRVCLCWCVEGHAVLWGDWGLAGVVLCGVWWRRGVFSWDSILRRRGVLGRGVGLGHRFRRSRGVLIAL